MPGLGGEVLERVGAEPVSLPGSEVFSSMQMGVIDATEWVSPFNDLALGLHTVAQYYYYPGWHEPGPTTELIINRDAWQSLPPDLQTMVETTARMINEDALSEFTARNARALKTLIEEHGVELRRLPDDVLALLKEKSDEVMARLVAGDPMARKVYASYGEFLEAVRAYHGISEQAYINARTAVLGDPVP